MDIAISTSNLCVPTYTFSLFSFHKNTSLVKSDDMGIVTTTVYNTVN